MLAKKQHYGKEFFHLIGSLKKASEKGHEILFFKKIGNHNAILNLLLIEGFLVSFQDYKSFVIIRLKIFTQLGLDNKSFISIEPASRIDHKNFTISLNELLSLQRREGGTAYYILNTDKGLLTSFGEIEKRVGGKLLLKIS
jgi:ribosomal protein S8